MKYQAGSSWRSKWMRQVTVVWLASGCLPCDLGAVPERIPLGQLAVVAGAGETQVAGTALGEAHGEVAGWVSLSAGEADGAGVADAVALSPGGQRRGEADAQVAG